MFMICITSTATQVQEKDKVEDHKDESQLWNLLRLNNDKEGFKTRCVVWASGSWVATMTSDFLCQRNPLLFLCGSNTQHWKFWLILKFYYMLVGKSSYVYFAYLYYLHNTTEGKGQCYEYQYKRD